jgi:hypothetical protein
MPASQQTRDVVMFVCIAIIAIAVIFVGINIIMHRQ